MDINKLALELQQNQSVRQKIYAQYMNNQDDFFFQNFHGILEEKVLFEYLQHAQKHKKADETVAGNFVLFYADDLIGACYSENPAPSYKCPKKLRVLTCSLRAFCFSSLRFVLNCARNGTILLHSGRYAPKRNLFTCRCSVACRLRKRHQQIGDSGRACAD